MKTKKITASVIQVCIILFFAACVILPILSMLTRITPQGFSEMVHSSQFMPAVWNSIATGLTATLLTLILSLAAAWCMERVAIRGKAFFGLIFVIPMLIPSISHAYGLVTLLGQNGILTNLLHLNSNLYGFWGIVAGSVMYSFPVSFLMFSGILQYEDGMSYKAAEVLGIPAFRRFTGISLPYLKKTIISAFFAVFTMIVTDYGVPLAIGGKTTTLSVLMYNKAVGSINYDAGSVIGAFLLIPAVIAFLVDLLNPEKGGSKFVSERVEASKSALARVLSYLYCGIVSLVVLSPIAAFAIMTFETKYPVNPAFTLYHIEKTINRGSNEYLLNSVLYALLTALIGTILAFICSYLTTRMRGKIGSVLHLISITSMAIPGLVLGLSYVIYFHATPIYGTLIIIVLANTIHFFASPYLMMYNTLGKVNPDLEDVGQTLGVGRLRIIRDVIMPKVKLTLFEMFVYFFVNAMMTISAVSFLAPPSPKPIALMINQFEAQRLMESVAFVSLLILLINLIVKILMNVIRSRAEKRAKKA